MSVEESKPLSMTFLEFRELKFRNNDELKIIKDEVCDTDNRWTETWYAVVKRTSDDTYWHVYYVVGSTEYQDTDDKQEFDLTEAVPVEKTITVYVEKDARTTKVEG